MLEGNLEGLQDLGGPKIVCRCSRCFSDPFRELCQDMNVVFPTRYEVAGIGSASFHVLVRTAVVHVIWTEAKITRCTLTAKACGKG